jgi:hypothetical protein
MNVLAMLFYKLVLLCRHHINPKVPMILNGNAAKYSTPLFNPLAALGSNSAAVLVQVEH